MPSSWRWKMAASPACSPAAASAADARLILFRARAVILATGGLGALYAVTTNPLEARGEGLGMAARAGALIADPEFVQFHPTAIAIGRDPAPLATEALRGEGAVLVNDRGERFMTARAHRCRTGAARYRGPRHPSPDRGGHQGLSGLPRGHRRELRSAFPHRVCRLHQSAGHRSGAASPSRWRRRRIITWAASPRTPMAAPRCPACGWWANAPPPACMAPTGWPPTRCWKAWCSAPASPTTCAAHLAAGAMRGTPPAPQRFATPAPPHVLRRP